VVTSKKGPNDARRVVWALVASIVFVIYMTVYSTGTVYIYKSIISRYQDPG
jgi:hypothetical protein